MAWFPFHAMRATRRGFNNVETLACKAGEPGSRMLCPAGDVIRMMKEKESVTLDLAVEIDRSPAVIRTI